MLARVTPFVWHDKTLVAWRASEEYWVPHTAYDYLPLRTEVYVASFPAVGMPLLVGVYDTGWITPDPTQSSEANIWSETQLAPVGDHLVVYVHRRIVVLSLPDAALEQ